MIIITQLTKVSTVAGPEVLPRQRHHPQRHQTSLRPPGQQGEQRPSQARGVRRGHPAAQQAGPERAGTEWWPDRKLLKHSPHHPLLASHLQPNWRNLKFLLFFHQGRKGRKEDNWGIFSQTFS